MADNEETLQDLVRRVREIADGLDAHSRTIASALAAPPPIQGSRITAAQHAITNLVNRFFQFLPEFSRAQFAQAEAMVTSAGERRIIPSDWLEVNAQIGLLRNALNNWPRVQGLIGQQVPSQPQPLYPDSGEIAPALAAQIAASDALHDLLHGLLNPSVQDGGAEAHGCFRDIALPHSAFLAHVHAAHRVLLAQGKTGATRFLDVGCGGGLKVLAATRFFDHAVGLEFDPGYAARAQALLSHFAAEGCSLVVGDALHYQDFARFDVIYFYRPMRHPDKLAELERRIAEAAHPGTLLIAPYDQFEVQADALGCSRIEGRLFLAGASADEAAGLRQRAEHIGTATPGRRAPLTDVWTPIVDASRRRGYAI